MQRCRILMGACVALALAGGPTAASGQNGTSNVARNGSASSTAVLRPGDQLRVVVFRKPELSGDFFINGDGTIQHPLYKKIVAAGVPMPVVESRILAALEEFEQAPDFVVEVLVRLSIGGEVRVPNVYALSPSVTVAEAIMLAGGATERGRLDRVRLVRGGRTLTLNLADPTGASMQTLVNSGDQIIVPQRRSALYDVVLPITSIVGTLASLAATFLIISDR